MSPAAFTLAVCTPFEPWNPSWSRTAVTRREQYWSAERPVAVGGRVEIRPMMYVALSYDHRIIDGKESVGFLVAVKEALENPKEILMNNLVEKALGL